MMRRTDVTHQSSHANEKRLLQWGECRKPRDREWMMVAKGSGRNRTTRRGCEFSRSRQLQLRTAYQLPELISKALICSEQFLIVEKKLLHGGLLFSQKFLAAFSAGPRRFTIGKNALHSSFFFCESGPALLSWPFGNGSIRWCVADRLKFVGVIACRGSGRTKAA